MKIIVHHSPGISKESYSFRWIEELNKNGVDVLPIDFSKENPCRLFDNVNGCMWHYFHNQTDKVLANNILNIAEIVKGIPVFPNLSTRWHFDEKVSQYYLLSSLNVPVVRTFCFHYHSDAINFLESAAYPLVFKLSVGAGGANILKVNSKKEAIKLTNYMFGNGLSPYTFNEFRDYSEGGFTRRLGASMRFLFGKSRGSNPSFYKQEKNYIYFQEYLKNNSYDIRITVIGNRAFGFTRYNRANDFRASGSGLIDYNLKNIPIESVSIAHSISQSLGFQSMAYDFLFDNDGKIVINEISYGYQNLAVYKCPGYWDRNLNWHAGNIWPETAHVEDFLFYVENHRLP